VFLAASFARLLGGGARAAALAAIAAGIAPGIAPGIAGFTSHLTTSTFEPIAWTGAAFLLRRAILRDRRSDLIWTGVSAGIAMEANWGIAVWLVALGVGVLATPARRILSWWQLWHGVAISAALFVPNLVWQWQHGWSFFEVILPHLDSQRNFTGPFWLFEWRQAMSTNLLLAPLCAAGMRGPVRPAPIEAAGVGAPLTQGLSDEFGWRELEQKVAAVFHHLTTKNARRYWLRITGKPPPSTSMAAPTPRALSGHNQNWLWGPQRL
jgi:hypothetical protein